MTSSPVTAERSNDTNAARAAARRRVASPRFYVALVTLVAAAVGMPLFAEYMGVRFRKEPVPLKASLAAFNYRTLEPHYRQHLIQAPPLDSETQQALGTSEYLQVRLVDTARAPSDPARIAAVFVTYYTGQPDMVPHVPDECYLAGGYDTIGGAETVEVSVPGVDAPDDRIPVRVLQFQSRDVEANRPTVLYFFHANGDYLTTRNGVRLRLAALQEEYAYYAKIEVTFSSDAEVAGRTRHANREQSVAALGPLLRELMPVLLEEHLAWDLVESGALPEGTD